MKKILMIALALVVTLGLFTTFSFGAVKITCTKSYVKIYKTTNQNSKETSYSTSAYNKQVANLVNSERKKAGLNTLTYDQSLAKAAQLKAEDMAKNKYFSHTSPSYGAPYEMLRNLGIKYSSQGENIAMGQKTPEAVMKAWMNSSGHKANILNSRYSKIGVGYAKSSNGTTYWVQEFTN